MLRSWIKNRVNRKSVKSVRNGRSPARFRPSLEGLEVREVLTLLTVTANSASRVYGDPNPAFTGTITGLMDGDNITATFSSTATAASSVGSYSIIPTLVDPNGRLGNYTVTRNNGMLTVTLAPLTVTATNKTRVYGAANPAFTGTITGLKNGDNITATYSCSATLGSSPGAYPITPTLVDPSGRLGNYTVARNNGTLTVTKAATRTTLQSSLSPSLVGQEVTFTATVARTVAGGGSPPAGQVTFSVGGVVQSTVSLSGTTATFRTSTLTLGSHAIVAAYSGNLNYTGSSAQLGQSVIRVNSLTLTRPTLCVGQGIPFSVTVSARDAAGNVIRAYRGTVSFSSSDPAAVLPSGYTFTAADNGSHAFTNGVTLNTITPPATRQAHALWVTDAALGLTTSGPVSVLARPRLDRLINGQLPNGTRYVLFEGTNLGPPTAVHWGAQTIGIGTITNNGATLGFGIYLPAGAVAGTPVYVTNCGGTSNTLTYQGPGAGPGGGSGGAGGASAPFGLVSAELPLAESVLPRPSSARAAFAPSALPSGDQIEVQGSALPVMTSMTRSKLPADSQALDAYWTKARRHDHSLAPWLGEDDFAGGTTPAAVDEAFRTVAA